MVAHREREGERERGGGERESCIRNIMITNSISAGPGRRPVTGFEYTPIVSEYPLYVHSTPLRHHLILPPLPLSRTAELREFFAEGF